MTTQLEIAVDSLNSLLRGEISAIENSDYTAKRFADEPEETALRRIAEDHRQAAGLLREHVTDRGGAPSSSSGTWGYFTLAVTGTANLMGRHASLGALKRGEEHGERAYEDALADDLLSEECLELISGHLLPRTRAHIEMLDRLMAGAARTLGKKST